MNVATRRIASLGSALAAAAACTAPRAHRVDLRGNTIEASTLLLPMYGAVHVLHTAGSPMPLAVFISGDGGWDATADRLAREVAHRGFAVAGVDIEALRDSVAMRAPSCADFGTMLGQLATTLASRIALTRARPLLVGHSAGASAVFVALAQTAGRRFAGGVSLSFAREFAFPVAPCRLAVLRWTPTTEAALYTLVPPAGPLLSRWSVVMGADDEVVPADEASRFAASVVGANFWRVSRTGHGLDDSFATARALDSAIRATAPGVRRSHHPSAREGGR